MPNKKQPTHDSRTHAQKRRAESKDAIRAKFQGIEYVNQLEQIGKEYDKIIAAMDAATVRKLNLTKQDIASIAAANMQIECLKFKLDSLKAKADLNFRRLRFVLPELKAIELSDPQGKNPFQVMADALKAAVLEDE